jgi:hypothetical protein
MKICRRAAALPLAVLAVGAPAFAQDMTPREFARDLAKHLVLGFAALPTGEWLVSSTGLYRSIDGGKTWDRVGPDIDLGGAIHVASDGIYAVGTALYKEDGKTRMAEGEAVVGLYRSRDAGATWTAVHTGKQAVWDPTQVLRTPKGALVTAHSSFGATGKTGLMRSSDDGKTWVPAGSHGLVFGFEAAADGTLFAASDSGVLSSTDDGASWTASQPDLATLSIRTRGTLAFAGSLKGLYRSTDNGTTWSPSGPFEEVIALPVVLAKGKVAVVTQSMMTGDIGLVLSEDDGKSWKTAASQIAARTVDGLFTDGTSIYLGTRRGVLRSTDDGRTFATVFP